jgi:DNA-binding NarL/FixJ family response regulator
MRPIKLAVVDDHHLFRKGLITLISGYDEISVVFEAPDGEALMEALKNQSPDVVLLDIEMPGMDGIEVADAIIKNYPAVKIIILTMHNEEELIVDLVEKGVHGFLLKDDNIEIVAEAICSVMEAGYYFNERVSKLMIRKLVESRGIDPVFPKTNLSDREIEVMRLICKEMTNKEIAVELCISARTVDGHRLNILKKINARNSIGIVIYAVKHKLLE